MSIISSDAKWAVLRRGVRLSPEEIRDTTKSKEYEAGFIAGATRQPTNEEIEAGARVLYRPQDNDWLPFEEASKCTREECCRKALAVLKAMQGKATEGGR